MVEDIEARSETGAVPGSGGSHFTSRRGLEAAYVSARYEVRFEDGRTVVFRIGEPVVELAGETFALITAFNPGSSRRAAEWNAEANARLETRLRDLGFAYVPGRGMSSDGTHIEPSFAVFDITRDAALALARDFGQAAIVWFDGASAGLAWTEEAEARRGT